MGRRVEKDLAELLRISARIFVSIRAECPGYGGGGADHASRLRTIEAYADAAHSLDRMAEALLTAGQPGAAERIAAEAEFQLRAFRDIEARLPEEASYTRWTWKSGIDLLERISRDCFTPLDDETSDLVDEGEDLEPWEDAFGLDLELAKELGIQRTFREDPPSPEPSDDEDLLYCGNAVSPPDSDVLVEVSSPESAGSGPQERSGKMIDLLIAQERERKEADLSETIRKQSLRIRQLESSLAIQTANSERHKDRENRIETAKTIAASFGRRDHILGNRTLRDEFGRRIAHLDQMATSRDADLARGAKGLLSSLSMLAWPETRTAEARSDIIADATVFRVQELSSAYEGVWNALQTLKDEVAQAGEERAGAKALLAERGGLLAIHQNRILRDVIGRLIAGSPALGRRIWRKQVRTAFERAGIAPTLGEFNARSEAQILNMYGVGPSSYEAVVEELAEAGIPSFHMIDKLARKPGLTEPDYGRIIRQVTGKGDTVYDGGISEIDRAFLSASEDAIRKAHLLIQNLTQMRQPRPAEVLADDFEARLARIRGMSDLFD